MCAVNAFKKWEVMSVNRYKPGNRFEEVEKKDGRWSRRYEFTGSLVNYSAKGGPWQGA